MSTNDDSASRRGRRDNQGEPDRRGPRQEPDPRWDQSSLRRDGNTDPFFDQRGQDRNPPRPGNYSGFSGHSYPRQDTAPTPPPARGADTPVPQQRFDPHPPQQQYYQEPAPRAEAPRPYPEQNAPSFAPPQSYEQDTYHDLHRDDLYAREAAAGYDSNSYAPPANGFQGDPYDRQPQRPAQAPQQRREEPAFYGQAPSSPLDDYERNFPQRPSQQDPQGARFFLPEEPQPAPQMRGAPQGDRGYAPPPIMPAAAPDRGYAPQSYAPNGYHAAPEPHDPYAHENYDPRYAPQEAWGMEEPPLHRDDLRSGVPQRVPHDDLDEDFFADEDDDHHDIAEPKRGRKKLVLAALAGAMAVGGGGAYVYKSMKNGESATPVIRADNRPSKELPGNPGGKQYPNGEKAIYDRLTPDGQQTASMAAIPAAQAFAPTQPSPGGNSLEDRIEEALKKARGSGDAPQSGAAQGQTADAPTVVKPEVYKPDGTRVDAPRPLIQPNISSIGAGNLPPPFGPGPTQAAAPFRTQAAPAPQFAPAPSPAPAPTARPASFAPAPAEPASVPQATGPGFYVSLKSSTDEKAIQRDIPVLTDKYKSVLGDVQLGSKIADLGAKGVTYRAVAGPLGTRQEAMDLCQKIKGVGGDKACFVTN